MVVTNEEVLQVAVTVTDTMIDAEAATEDVTITVAVPPEATTKATNEEATVAVDEKEKMAMEVVAAASTDTKAVVAADATNMAPAVNEEVAIMESDVKVVVVKIVTEATLLHLHATTPLLHANHTAAVLEEEEESMVVKTDMPGDRHIKLGLEAVCTVAWTQMLTQTSSEGTLRTCILRLSLGGNGRLNAS